LSKFNPEISFTTNWLFKIKIYACAFVPAIHLHPCRIFQSKAKCLFLTRPSLGLLGSWVLEEAPLIELYTYTHVYINVYVSMERLNLLGPTWFWGQTCSSLSRITFITKWKKVGGNCVAKKGYNKGAKTFRPIDISSTCHLVNHLIRLNIPRLTTQRATLPNSQCL
jgi:hypothetical protein